MSAEQRYTKEEMDKRDMFACAVLAALVGIAGKRENTSDNVKWAYHYANHMIRERLE